MKKISQVKFSLSPLQVTEKDGEWSIKTSTTLKTMELKFKLGEEFDETTPDGREVKAIVTQVRKAGKVGVLDHCLPPLLAFRTETSSSPCRQPRRRA